MKFHNMNIAHHRNGICGTPFYVAIFDWRDDDGKTRRMMATVFPEPGNVAVLDISETAAGNIDFACGNSWRGDHFEDALRAAIRRTHEDPPQVDPSAGLHPDADQVSPDPMEVF
jgi:hypothetical protein